MIWANLYFIEYVAIINFMCWFTVLLDDIQNMYSHVMIPTLLICWVSLSVDCWVLDRGLCLENFSVFTYNALQKQETTISFLQEFIIETFTMRQNGCY